VAGVTVPASADVVIVGSGAVGSALAARLSVAGRRVLILEAGPARANRDLVSSALWSRRLKWGGAPVLDVGPTPIGHAFNAGYATGGGALHHYAVWPRMHAEDFVMQTRYGRGLDWPVTYDDLRPYYDVVQSEVGISGDAALEVWRPPGVAYPLPAAPLFAQGEVIQRGFSKLGRKTSPIPLAITTRAFRGRPACLWDGWCDAGCPIGALANPLTVHLPQALTAGAKLINRATVVRVASSADGSRVTGVEYVDADNVRRSVDAGLVILAAFAIENPRLLLASKSRAHGNGLANASGLVGRYLMAHLAALLYGLFNAETMPHMGATGGQLLNQDHYPKLTHAKEQAFGSYQWLIAQAVKPVDLLGIGNTRPELYGEALHAFMRRAAQHFGTMVAIVEDLPVAQNRVELAAEHDRHGVPLAQVKHAADPSTKALWQAAIADGKAIFSAAGAREAWIGPQACVHIMGGTIMGRDPRHSVTNSYGQTHDIANLFAAGPGLFPTSSGVNPTFTAHALARRTADYIEKRFSELTS
jgi:choline dehydrogenase-like flavoprotein